MTYHKKILANGLRLITVPMKDNPTVTVMALVEAGSKYETKEINGLSHFLEHMCFKGTKTRPTALDISRELDSIGSQYNAFTSQEFTGYYAKADYRHFDTVLDVVSDIYLHSAFPEKEMEKEKGVIVEELNMYRDLPQRYVQDLFMQLLYGDQPAGWDIVGTKETVTAMNRQNFIDYRGKHYVSGATSVIVSGNVREEKTAEAVAKAFSKMNDGPKHGKTKVTEAQTKPAVKIEHRKTDQTHLVLGVRTFDTYDKRNRVMRVLSGVLSGGMSSRLFQKLREEMGVCYYVSASHDAYTDHGNFAVSAGVDRQRLTEVIRAILDELNRLKTETVPARELKKVKDYLVGSMYLGLESSDSLADFYGYQEILKKPLKEPKEITDEIQSVTASEIKELAGALFQDSTLNLALIGPVEDSKQIEPVLRF